MTAKQITSRLWITSQPVLDDDSLQIRSVISLEDVAQFPAKNGFASYCLAQKNTQVQLGVYGAAIVKNHRDSADVLQKDNCMVSYLAIGQDEHPITITLFGVQGDKPLSNTEPVLHELYESYKRTLKEGVTLIHAADPAHAEQIILTFLFFEAYWYIKKEDFQWCKDTILDDLRRNHSDKFKNKEHIMQAETNAFALYQHVLLSREIKSAANKLLTYQSAHLCSLPMFSAWFNKKEQKKQKKLANAPALLFTPKVKAQEEKRVIEEGRRCCSWFGC